MNELREVIEKVVNEKCKVSCFEDDGSISITYGFWDALTPKRLSEAIESVIKPIIDKEYVERAKVEDIRDWIERLNLELERWSDMSKIKLQIKPVPDIQECKKVKK